MKTNAISRDKKRRGIPPIIAETPPRYKRMGIEALTEIRGRRYKGELADHFIAWEEVRRRVMARRTEEEYDSCGEEREYHEKMEPAR